MYNFASNSASLYLLRNSIASLTANELDIILTGVQVVATLLTAYFAVKIALIQLRKEFENKVVYEGWIDFQEKLFKFSNQFTNYSVTVLWLKSDLKMQNNPLINGGNAYQYKVKKRDELNTAYQLLVGSYIEFLRSFETHEVIFIDLLKMKELFINEYRSNVEDKAMNFANTIFPMIETGQPLQSTQELESFIDQHYEEVTKVSVYLEDFRIELQNATVGKILNKRLKQRKPTEHGHKILTQNGIITS